MQCNDPTAHEGHHWTTPVWDGKKYVQKSVYCPGKM
jgi:hypothetical protein